MLKWVIGVWLLQLYIILRYRGRLNKVILIFQITYNPCKKIAAVVFFLLYVVVSFMNLGFFIRLMMMNRIRPDSR